MQLLIVGDDDPLMSADVRSRGLDPKLLSFLDGLMRDSQRCQNENRAISFADNVLCPHQLLYGLAKPAVSKDRSPPLAKRPIDKSLLEIE